ncbi:protein-cysteine N-palmitoyltransferase HHAT [Thrips palmi]|uniref:Protein-cysteine N-palmitoyltransferase HHAT n=1 Tax=Thrips palmi TaxID=161013 RepID=A0A6P8YDW7_THRPL|nr:protein-cysteine N-palmitoyltransferase HHAT [Thrips palmi]
MNFAATASLPAIEVAAYSVIWIGGVFYSAYHVYAVSDIFGRQMGVEELTPGWSFVGRKKDISDYEWRMWLPFLWELAPWFLLHITIAEILRWYKSKELLRLWYVMITSLFMVHYCGWISWAAVISAPIILFSISRKNRPLLCWTTSIILLLCLSTFHISALSEEQQMALYVCFAWVQLRCMSFCLDWINSKPWSNAPLSQDDHSPQWLRLLSYTCYLPLMFLGPFVPYLDFENGINADTTSCQSLKRRILKLVLNSSRFLGWMAITEYCLHFIYCNAIQLHHEALPYLDAWTLHGLAYCIGQFFLNKYVVIYGLMGTLSQFDSVSPPPVPRCIAHIAKYSDMWRHFDRGFYNFLRSYIYDPLVEGFPKKQHHLLLSTICFAFVYVWHGLSMNILIWSICNFLGIVLESVAHEVIKSKSYQHFESKLSMQNIRRWRAFMTGPLFIMSALTMFFFLGSMEVGVVFVSQIIHGKSTIGHSVNFIKARIIGII